MRSSKRTLGQRLLGFSAALALIAPAGIAVTATPAAADGCTGGGDQSGVSQGTCNDGGTGGSAPDTSWQIVAHYYDQPCINRNGQPSHMVDGVHIPDGATDSFCLVTFGEPGTNIYEKASLAVPDPSIEPDFKVKFLTGATVTFNSDATDNTDLVKRIPEFPGVSLHVRPVPGSCQWDFGDGTTARGCGTVRHTYQSKVPNPSEPNKHEVTVTMRVQWHGYLHMDNAGGPADTGVIDLGLVTTTNSQTWPIVEVWSQLTEPR